MRESNRVLVKNLQKKIAFPEPIYDIGGAGFEFMWDFPVTTVDINPQAHIIADCTDLSVINDGTVGTVLTTDTFEHIKEPWQAVAEIWRILKPGGLLILSTVLLWDYHDFPSDYFRFTTEGLRSLCHRFEEIECSWQEEDVPLDDLTGRKAILPHAGVYFIGRKL